MAFATVATLVFPKDEIEAQLKKELLITVEIEASLHDIELPKDPAAKAAVPLRIDSLVVVEILCAVEPIADIKLEDKLVRAGGYRSIDDAVTSLMPRIEKEWLKQKGGKN